MLGSNPSADSEAGMAGRRVHRLPYRSWRGCGAAGGLGAAAPNCEATRLFWHERAKSRGFGGGAPNGPLWEQIPN